MTVRLERISSNIIDIIDKLLKNQELCNLLGDNGNIPVAKPVLAKDIAPMSKKARVYAYPFDIDYRGEERSQLHIYYPNFEFSNNGHAVKMMIIFDIVVHKNIWLMLDNGKKVIRAYEIVRNIVSTMNGVSIGDLGKIHFMDGNHTLINSDFEGIRLVAQFTEF